MNMTIGSNDKSNSFKTIKARYLTTAAGLALAATAVIAGQPWATTSTPASAAVHSAASVIRSSDAPLTTHYLVANEAEKARLVELFAGDAGARPSNVSIDVLVVDNAAKLDSVAATLQEQVEAGQNYAVVDLRPEAQTPAVVARTTAFTPEYASAVTAQEQYLAQMTDQGNGTGLSDEVVRNNQLRYEEAAWGIY
jgi:hypothetical protein